MGRDRCHLSRLFRNQFLSQELHYGFLQNTQKKDNSYFRKLNITIWNINCMTIYY